MLLSTCLAIALCQPPPEGFVPENTEGRVALRVKAEGEIWSLDWADTEDRVRGTVSPLDVTAGAPVTLSVAVGSFATGDFDGPVTLGLESVDGAWRGLETVQPSRDPPRVWNATFTPPSSGPHTIKVSFRTTRQKSLRGPLEIGTQKLSRSLALVVGMGAILLAVVYGLFLLFGKNGAPSEAPGPPPPS